MRRAFTVKRCVLVSLVALMAGSVLYLLLVPNVSKLKKENPKKTSFMAYRESVAKKAGTRTRQIWVPYSRISPYLVKAVIIAEDDKFWSHEGFDYEAIQEAVEKNLKAGKIRAGGSTITQQLAKNLYLTPEKTLLRKIREAVITWRIERALSKRRILELYLNVVEWGDGIYGVEAASRHYFGKYSAELTPMEAARLVAVLPNPRRYDPAGDQRYVVKRSNMIYDIMVRRGIVIPEYEEIEKEEPSPVETSAEAPGTGAEVSAGAVDETAPAEVVPAPGPEGDKATEEEPAGTMQDGP